MRPLMRASASPSAARMMSLFESPSSESPAGAAVEVVVADPAVEGVVARAADEPVQAGLAEELDVRVGTEPIPVPPTPLIRSLP